MSWGWADEQREELARFPSDRGICAGPVTAKPIGDGHSNLTFLACDGERQVVVRRPQPPPGAYDPDISAVIINLISIKEVSAPRTKHEDLQGAVIGSDGGLRIVGAAGVTLARVSGRLERGRSGAIIIFSSCRRAGSRVAGP